MTTMCTKMQNDIWEYEENSELPPSKFQIYLEKSCQTGRYVFRCRSKSECLEIILTYRHLGRIYFCPAVLTTDQHHFGDPPVYFFFFLASDRAVEADPGVHIPAIHCLGTFEPIRTSGSPQALVGVAITIRCD